jgi:hypothetical protein
MKSVKALFLLRTSLLNLMISMTDVSDDDGYLPQVSDDRVRFSPSAQEAKVRLRLFLARPTKNFPKAFIIEIVFGVKTWLNQTLLVVAVFHWPCREFSSYRRREELPCNSITSLSLFFAIVVCRVVVCLLVVCYQINVQFLFNWLFIHLKSGYSTILPRILQ